MSAARIDLVLEAARLMRERAQAATPGPWGVGNDTVVATEVGQESPGCFSFRHQIADIREDDYDADYGTPRENDATAETDAEHIASWHPAVALAVADWLAATHADFAPIWTGPHVPPDLARALAVARAYLGRDS